MHLAQGWSVNVDRGPDWLFVNLQCSDDAAREPVDLAENLWHLLQCHFGQRMVIEMDDVPRINSALLAELALLGRRISGKGGMLRLSGVSDAGQRSIRAAQLDRLFPCYPDRTAAVMGERPRQPR